MVVPTVCHDGRVAWAVDLDGVMWLGDEPIAGSAGAVRRLREAGDEVVFVTNNSSSPVGEVEAKLARHGVEAAGAVLTSAMAAATLVGRGDRVLVCGGPGIVEAVAGAGAVVVEEGPADVVIVGFTRAFDFDLLARASAAVRAGARLVGTNGDPTYPTPAGQVPGGGAILAAVAAASGVPPTVAGKPHPPMADLVRARLGPVTWMVGDRPDTDGAMARVLGCRFGLVHSGVTAPEGATGDVVPDRVAPDLATLVDRELAGRT